MRPHHRHARRIRTILLLLLPLLSAFSCERSQESRLLTVYVYDSFSAKGGLGPLVAERFKERHGVETRYVSFDSAGEALNQIALEGEATRADVLLGVDEMLLPRALETNAFVPCEGCLASVDKEVRLDGEGRFVPFDYGYLAVIYDGARTQPKRNLTLLSLASDPQLRRQLAWIDPRTSSLGLTFLAWTRQEMEPAQAERFWRGMGSQVITFSPGWSGAYGLFLKNEAAFVLSYTTSPAYHLNEDPKSQVRAVLFPEGQARQTEGVGLVRYSANREWGKKWIEFLLSDEIQQALPLRQWMYPARSGVPLPPVFQNLPPIKKAVVLDRSQWAENREKWLGEWTRWVAAVR